MIGWNGGWWFAVATPEVEKAKKTEVYFLTLSFLSGFIFLSSPYWLEIDWNFLIMKCWTLISIRSADEVWTPPTVLERHINSRCSLQSSCESTVLYLFSSRRLLNESGEGERCPQHLVFGFRKSGAAQNTLYILSEKKRGFMITARKWYQIRGVHTPGIMGRTCLGWVSEWKNPLQGFSPSQLQSMLKMLGHVCPVYTPGSRIVYQLLGWVMLPMSWTDLKGQFI